MYNSCGSDVVHGVAPTASHTDLAWVVGYRLGIVAVLAIRPIPGMRAGMMEMMELYKECRTRRPSLSPVRPEPDFAAAGHPGAIAIAGPRGCPARCTWSNRINRRPARAAAVRRKLSIRVSWEANA